MTITGELVQLREAGLTTVRHAENLLDKMGLLASRTEGGLLHSDRVLKSIQIEQAEDEKETS